MLFVQFCAVILLCQLFATTWGAVNLALNKPATQSSEYSTSYPAGNAVNGNTNDFFHTADGRDVSWWRVNLGAKYRIGSIKIYNRDAPYGDRLRRTSILTSNATSPATPSLTSNDWTEVTYQGPFYPEGATTHFFNPPIEGQYVAVYNEESSGLALKEVEVFDYNYALSKPTDSSSNQGNSYRATDGDLSTSTSTINEQSPWWKVDLGEAILLREVLVFVKDGQCGSPPFECSSRLTEVYFLTSTSNAAAEPNTAENNGWNQCYYSEQARGDYYTVQCNESFSYPLARLFSIRSTAVTRVELRQVETYGFELPQLSANIDGRADTVTTTSITVSFKPWNQLMTGGSPPTGYTVQLSGGQSKTVPHNTNSQRLSATLNGLDPWKTYTFTVSCTIQGIACTGSTHSFTASTSCAVPDVPGAITISAIKTQHGGRQRWKYTTTWMAPSNANCADVVQYQYNVAGQSTALQTTTTAVFYLDGDQPFEFIVKAKNSVGFSTPRRKSDRSGVLNPQFNSGQITITASSAYCVTVTWSVPQYPGGNISQYQHRCGSEGWMGAGGDKTKDSCGHQPNTQVTCWIRAKNSAGWGTTQYSGITDCAPPDIPGEITLSAIRIQHSGRQRWKYAAAWRVPSEANCADVVQYQCNLDGQPTALQTTTTTVFYLDGDLPFEFIVKAKNSVGFSTPRSKSERSGVLNPQFNSGKITVTASSAYCVTVTWPVPQYPGGNISQYQYKCGGESYMTAGVGDRTKESCSHLPNTQISCWVRAKNSAGWGSAMQSTAITDCVSPDIPGEITLSAIKIQHSSRQRWKYTATWTVPSKANCGDAVQYQYNLVGQPTALQTTTTATFYLDGDLPFELIVKAKNSVGFSTPRRKSDRSGVLTPQFGTNHISLTGTSSECVTLSWTAPEYPGGDITQYQYRCGEDTFTDVGLQTTNIESCGYEPYTEVTCRFKAGNIAGFSDIQTAVARTLCVAPMFSLSSSEGPAKTATVEVYIQESRHECSSLIPSYTITIRDPERELLYNTTNATAGNHTIANAAPFTNYTVTIGATNDTSLQSLTVKSIVTVETAPSDGPKLDVTFTESCVVLHIQPPEYPNGIIKVYQYWCAEAGKEYRGSTPVTVEELVSGIVPNVCKFPQVTEIVCDVYAVNGAGESPVSSASGYTKATVSYSPAPQLLSPSETNSNLVVIWIHPVDLEDSTLTISSYLVLLRNRSSSEIKGAVEEKCYIDGENCITVAEIGIELLTADGYWFHIGDGKLYGGYVNSALVPKSSYFVQIAISVQLPEDGNVIYQTLNEELSFTAPTHHCQPPPYIGNTLAGSSSDEEIGGKVRYACDAGSQRTSGDFQLSCELNDDYETEWVGKRLVCTKGLSVALGVGIGAAIVVMGLLGALVFKKVRGGPAVNSNQSPGINNELVEYAELSVPKPSNFTKPGFDQTKMQSQAEDSEYDTIDQESNPAAAYEMRPPTASTSDHVYTTAGKYK